MRTHRIHYDIMPEGQASSDDAHNTIIQFTNRVLIVSTHLSHPTNAGNRVAIMAQVDSYQQLGYEVHYLFANTSLRHNMDLQEMRQYWGDRYHEYEMPWLLRAYRYLQDFWRRYACHGYWKADDHYPTGLARYTKRLDEQYHFDAVVVQYMRLSKLLTNVSIPRKAIFTHDVFAYKDIRTGDFFYETCNAHEEARALQRCPNIFAIQEQEATYYQFIAPLSKVFTVYNSYSFHHQPVVKNKNVLFVASTMKFNVEAIEKFLVKVWPLVLQHVPDAKLKVAGAICTMIPQFASDNIELLGHVDSLDDFYSLGNIVINPVFNGTGLKIKTFEALSYGKTTLVHPHSLTGIFDKDTAPLYTATTAQQWADMLTMLLDENHDYAQDKQKAEDYIARMNDHVLAQYRTFLTE